MKITSALKAHMVQKGWAKAEDSDELINKAIGDQIGTGSFAIDEVQRLATQDVTEGEKKLNDMVTKAVSAALEPVLARFATAPAAAAVPAGPVLTPTPGAGQKAFALAAGATGSSAEFEGSPDDVLVKSAVERYQDTRTSATFDKSSNEFVKKSFGGQRVMSTGLGGDGYALDIPTDRMKAQTGAWFKLLVNKACRRDGRAVPQEFLLTEHDRQLNLFTAHNSRFVGPIGYKGGFGADARDTDAADDWYNVERLKDHRNGDLWIKTLLDDSTSGGLEAVPIEFDASLILTPILNGELFPLVTLRNVTRRRIEATSISNPTLTWGGASGTQISLFDTDSFISAFDTNIYVVDGAMELGRDFLSDSPLDIGGTVQERYGQVFLKEMDNVIATGDGTTQPEGLFTASGVTAITTVGGAGAAQQVGDYELLMHGIAKEFQQEAGLPPNSRMVFLGTQTSYQRSRSIPVDSSNDARRIFGQDNQLDYRLMALRYSINASLTNAQIGCFCMNRYRMYRRLGIEVQVVSGDVYSARRNTQTVVVRARFGGALEKSGAGAKITTGQA